MRKKIKKFSKTLYVEILDSLVAINSLYCYAIVSGECVRGFTINRVSLAPRLLITKNLGLGEPNL